MTAVLGSAFTEVSGLQSIEKKVSIEHAPSKQLFRGHLHYCMFLSCHVRVSE